VARQKKEERKKGKKGLKEREKGNEKDQERQLISHGFAKHSAPKP
jgi:hypothetical protein